MVSLSYEIYKVGLRSRVEEGSPGVMGQEVGEVLVKEYMFPVRGKFWGFKMQPD